MAPLEPDTRSTIEAYLLGRVSEAEAEALEERYFGDDALYEQVEFIEELLIRSYLQGSLPVLERTAFESFYLQSADHRQKVQAQRDLIAAIEQSRPVRRRNPLREFFFRRDPFPRWALALATLLIAVPGAAVTVRMLGLERELESSRRAGEERLLLALAEKLGRQQAESRLNELTTVQFGISPGLTRSGGGSILRVPTAAGFVSFELGADSVSVVPSGRVTFLDASGAVVWSQTLGPSQVGPSGGVKVRIPAQALKQGSHTAVIESAGRKIFSYSFAIERN